MTIKGLLEHEHLNREVLVRYPSCFSKHSSVGTKVNNGFLTPWRVGKSKAERKITSLTLSWPRKKDLQQLTLQQPKQRVFRTTLHIIYSDQKPRFFFKAC